jgi:acetoacetyl-CoA synthetase
MPLFVVPSRPIPDTETSSKNTKNAIRVCVSPRHVPDDVIVVDALPHTRTGKKLEVPVKRILQGADPASVVKPQAIDDPDALTRFHTFRPQTTTTLG